MSVVPVPDPALIAVRAIFDREIAEAEENLEPSPMIDWLERLRDEVLAALQIRMADLVHRFSWLPYDHSGAAGHVGVLVAVCDCGWNDLTGSGQGTGIDVAALYSDHVKGTHIDGTVGGL